MIGSNLLNCVFLFLFTLSLSSPPLLLCIPSKSYETLNTIFISLTINQFYRMLIKFYRMLIKFITFTNFVDLIKLEKDSTNLHSIVFIFIQLSFGWGEFSRPWIRLLANFDTQVKSSAMFLNTFFIFPQNSSCFQICKKMRTMLK